MNVACTEKSQVLAVKIAKTLQIDVIDTRFSRFPDGEHYLKAEGLDDETIIVGSVTDADSFLQLLLLIDACRGSDSTLVVPYMGYARQDKRFHPGEPVSARAIAGALSTGVREVYTVNVHEEGICGHFGVTAHNVSVAAEISAFIGTLGLDDPLILAPDAGASEFAGAVAAAGSWDCDELRKTRLSGTEVRVEPKNLDVTGRDAVIVDDIISTGGTLATAARMLREQEASGIHAICVHGVFAAGAYARLRHAGIETIAASDTIECGCSSFSAAGSIAARITGK